jgi:hypothetical protein
VSAQTTTPDNWVPGQTIGYTPRITPQPARSAAGTDHEEWIRLWWTVPSALPSTAPSYALPYGGRGRENGGMSDDREVLDGDPRPRGTTEQPLALNTGPACSSSRFRLRPVSSASSRMTARCQVSP